MWRCRVWEGVSCGDAAGRRGKPRLYSWRVDIMAVIMLAYVSCIVFMRLVETWRAASPYRGVAAYSVVCGMRSNTRLRRGRETRHATSLQVGADMMAGIMPAYVSCIVFMRLVETWRDPDTPA